MNKQLALKFVFWVIGFQLVIVALTLTGCFVRTSACDEKEHEKILGLMMSITTQSFALYAAEK
tara:strand:+ start:80 stop:268 length:189 start_codon:yes stop_codon:yes gene_type:complete